MFWSSRTATPSERCWYTGRGTSIVGAMDQTNKQPNSDTASVALSAAHLLSDLSLLIDSTRQRVARTVNAELVLMYWKMGARIRQDILGQERAAYGEQIVSTLSRQLSASYGSGFSRPNLFHMIKFAEAWPDEMKAIESWPSTWAGATSKKSSTSTTRSSEASYAEMCRVERWRRSRTLQRSSAEGMLFERTAISRGDRTP